MHGKKNTSLCELMFSSRSTKPNKLGIANCILLWIRAYHAGTVR